MNITLYPERSWSKSRMSMLEDCERSYYYQYYLSHNGWDNSKPQIVKTAYKLKNLTNIYMLKGIYLHEQFKLAIQEIADNKNVAYKTEDDINNAVINKLNEAVRDTLKNIKTKNFDMKRKGMMLQDYYYGGVIEKEVADSIKEDNKTCIENFFKCKTYDIISTLSNIKILEIDEEVYNNTLLLDDVKLYFKADLIYEDEKGIVWIIDWKTGKYSEADKEQLILYAYYAASKYGLDINKIKGRIEYLLSGENFEMEFDDELLQYAEEKIMEDLHKINIYLENTKENEPKEQEIFLKNDNRCECSYCKFRELCKVDK